MNTYLLTLIDKLSKLKYIAVQSDCPHGMQEFVDRQDIAGMDNPVVVDVKLLPHVPADDGVTEIEVTAADIA